MKYNVTHLTDDRFGGFSATMRTRQVFMRRFSLKLFLFLAMAGLFISGQAAMAVPQVVTSNADSGPGTLRQAIADTINNDWIRFALPAGNETITLTSELSIASGNRSIDGANSYGSGRTVTVKVTAPGTSEWRVMSYNAIGGTLTLENLNLEGGSVGPTGRGGAVYVKKGALDMTGVTVSNSKAAWGGAVYAENNQGPLRFANCTFFNNTATGDGTNYSLGGAVMVHSQTATFRNCTLTGNSASGITPKSEGGAIFALGTVSVTNCTITGNSVSGGTTANTGGGIHSWSSSASLNMLNTIVIGNTATGPGAAGADLQADGPTTAYYCWYSGVGGTVSTQGSAPNINTAYAAGDLLPLADNGGRTKTIALGAGAPALGAGTFAYYNETDGDYFQGNDAAWHRLDSWATTPTINVADKLTTDQRGTTRVSPTSIGAYHKTHLFIRGRVTQLGRPKPGVNVRAGSASATTDIDGNYVISNLSPGETYVVAPSLEGGYRFIPPFRTVTINNDGPGVTDCDFTVDVVRFYLGTSGKGSTTPPTGSYFVPRYVPQTISAVASAGAGYHWSAWSADNYFTTEIASTTSATTTVTLRDDSVVRANFALNEYKIRTAVNPDLPALYDYVGPGSVGVPYPRWHGASYNLFAANARAMSFVRWESSDPAIVLDDPTLPSIPLLAYGDVTFTAYYAAASVTLTVDYGTGSGKYLAGTKVPIEAGVPPGPGMMFDVWMGHTAGVEDITKPATTFTMPADHVTLRPSYKVIPPVEYTLTVVSGSGGGKYQAGKVVTLNAALASDGQQFDKWVGDTAGVVDVGSTWTPLYMPSNNATVTATYKPLQPTFYHLSVFGGAGSGNYRPGTSVTIQAGVATEGQIFSSWTGSNLTFGNRANPTTTLTMPTANATVAALFKESPPTLYALTVLGGTGSGTYKAGTSVTVMAGLPPDGHMFDKWSGQTSTMANINEANTSLIMPAGPITVVAQYARIPIPKYTLRTLSGTGTGEYQAGTIVPLMAATVPAGQMFDCWVGQVSTVGNVNYANTTLTMPAADVTVQATYKPIPEPTYDLTVINGLGSGTFTAGANVIIMANVPPAGKMFDRWIGQAANIANPLAPNTTVTMPREAIEVKATFRELPQEASYTLTLEAGSGGGLYRAGTVVTIAAGLPATGTVFDRWIGQTGQVTNSAEANTTLIMPPGNITVRATYKPLPGTKFSLRVASGTGTGEYEAGTSVSIMADAAPSGQRFNSWTGQTSYIANVNTANTTLTMPASNLEIAAGYVNTSITKRYLTVTGGSTSGWFAPGDIVSIQTKSPYMIILPPMMMPGGMVMYPPPFFGYFMGWTGQNSTVKSLKQTSTTLVMPDFDIEVIATWSIDGKVSSGTTTPQKYQLTIVGGSGGGSYVQSAIAKIMANPPAAGKVFDRWSGQTQGVANLFAANTEVTMPAFAETISATYKDLPPTTFRLTVASGTGSGDYEMGRSISLVAGLPPDGRMFDQWTGQTTSIANPFDANTTLTMPAASVSVAATYKQIPAITYPLSVASGTGSGDYRAGSTVSIMAAVAPDGLTFDQWIGETSSIDNVLHANTTLTMQAASCSIRATYKEIPVERYTLTVASGTGSGQYRSGAIVPLMAQPPADGLMFDQWTGQNSTVANVNAANTTLTMPDGAIEVRATYRAVAVASYALAVASGTGSGQYKSGTVVGLAADLPPTGVVFDIWTGQTANMANPADPNTTLTMPDADTGVRATYRPASTTAYTLTVASGTGSGRFPSGTAITLTAKPPQTGMIFDKWIGQTSNIANVLLPTTTLVMPAADIEVRASYASAVTQVYPLTVTGGSGGGSFAPAAVVPVQAHTAAAGMMFDKWTGQTSYLADVGQASTTLTMPATGIEIRATYRAIPAGTFRLIVGDGSGTGDYAAATVVSIVATQPPSGKVFDRWVGQTAVVADIFAASTTLTMPAADTEVRASFLTPPPAILVQPVNRTVATGDNASFTITATRAATLQWQVNSGSGFVDIVDGPVYTGATTPTLTITGATAAMNGYVFRCIAAAPQLVNAESDSATLSVFAAVFADGMGNKYASWADAIAGVAEGGTLTLQGDFQLPTDLTVTKSVTLDLNGKTLSGNFTVTVADNKNLTLMNRAQQGAFDARLAFAGNTSGLAIVSNNVFSELLFRNDGSPRFPGEIKGDVVFGDGTTPVSYTFKTRRNGVGFARQALKRVRVRDKADIGFTHLDP